ncbi:Zinc ribbon domain-containing protein [Candidatus Magnetomoraceae bacterium gMMP-15]
MLTKQDILDQMLSQEKPKCPHCNQEMTIWEVPEINMGDGLGWGTPYLYVCFNDECPSYKEGWKNLKENYAHCASYRCFCYPDKKHFEFIPVFSPVGGTSQIIDENVLADQERLKEAIKIGFATLAECYVKKDIEAVIHVLLDAAQPARVRLKAAEMAGDIGGIEVIELLRSSKFGYDLVQKEVDKSIKKIHERNFTRECPFCAEIIKKRAKICKHCNKEVAGL